MAVLRVKDSEGNWVIVSGGGGVSGSDTLIIHSDKDFEVIEEESLVGVISDPNTTYNDIKNAIDNNYTIVLKEPRGNLSYCLRADFVLEDQESGNKRIALFFTKSILTIRYDIILYIGLNNSIVYMISKNDIFSKQEVEESIDNKAPYVGEEEPTTDTVLWIDPTGTPSGETSGGSSGGNSANEPIVLYFAMDGNLSEQQKQSNATNVALLIDAISQGKYGNNFLIGLVVSGSVMTLAQPFFYAAFNGMLKVGTSFSAVKESTQFYWVAQRLSFGTDGNVTIE